MEKHLYFVLFLFSFLLFFSPFFPSFCPFFLHLKLNIQCVFFTITLCKVTVTEERDTQASGPPTSPQGPRFSREAALPQSPLFIYKAQWNNLALEPGQTEKGHLPWWEVQERAPPGRRWVPPPGRRRWVPCSAESHIPRSTSTCEPGSCQGSYLLFINLTNEQ